MHRFHVFVVGALLAGAAVLGTYAALRTTTLGAAHRSALDAAVGARTRQLNRFEAALRAKLAQKMPALPPVPARRTTPAPAPRVVYRRPPSIVLVRHTAHHDDEGSGEREGSDD